MQSHCCNQPRLTWFSEQTLITTLDSIIWQWERRSLAEEPTSNAADTNWMYAHFNVPSICLIVYVHSFASALKISADNPHQSYRGYLRTSQSWIKNTQINYLSRCFVCWNAYTFSGPYTYLFPSILRCTSRFPETSVRTPRRHIPKDKSEQTTRHKLSILVFLWGLFIGRDSSVNTVTELRPKNRGLNSSRGKSSPKRWEVGSAADFALTSWVPGFVPSEVIPPRAYE
jgi:hypothetical protein